MRKHNDTLIVLIGIFKLVKGVLLIALGVGALSMLHKDVIAVITQWVHPGSRVLQPIISKLDGLNDHKLVVAGIGGLLYAAMFLTEGVGLLLRKVWAEYLTIIITTSFIPLEVYELVEHRSVAKAIVIVVNVAVVVYLVLRLRADHRWPFAKHKRRGRRAQGAAATGAVSSSSPSSTTGTWAARQSRVHGYSP